MTNRWSGLRAISVVLATVLLAVMVMASPASASTSTARYKNVGTGLCLWWNVTPYPTVVAYCGDLGQVQWKWNNAVHNGIWSFQISGSSDRTQGRVYCLTAPYSTDGDPTVASCNAANDTGQQWRVNYTTSAHKAFTLQNVQTGFCLIVDSSHVVQTTVCTSTTAEQWTGF